MINTIIFIFIIIFAKILSFLSRFFKKGSGTALPGFIVENYTPWILGRFKQKLKNIIFVSGTNGKTTTRAMIVHVLEESGQKVITNRGGANIYRGIASTLFGHTNLLGQIKADIAVLEVEEATMPKLSKYLPPDILILTNIFRDQLDAYGEVDTTLKYFQQTIKISKPKVIVNGDDYKLLESINKICQEENLEIIHFGLQQEKKYIPDFEENSVQANALEKNSVKNSQKDGKISQIEAKSGFYHFTFVQNNHQIKSYTLLPGRYNLYNTAAALTTLCYLRENNLFLNNSDSNSDNNSNNASNKNSQNDAECLQKFQPVFGRGELIKLENEVTLMLVKNPAGFNQVLDWISEMYSNEKFYLDVCINDNIADGKDVSWLWDVNLEDFYNNFNSNQILQVSTAGTRAFDMALRLEYAGFNLTKKDVFLTIPDLSKTLQTRKQKSIVLCTYTSLLQLRSELGKVTSLSSIQEKGN